MGREMQQEKGEKARMQQEKGRRQGCSRKRGESKDAAGKGEKARDGGREMKRELEGEEGGGVGRERIRGRGRKGDERERGRTNPKIDGVSKKSFRKKITETKLVNAKPRQLAD